MCGTLLALSGSLIALPGTHLAVAGSTVNPVLLPTDAGHTLIGGPAGWTSSAQVTATGCGAGSCPVAVGMWDGGASTGGALQNTLSGSAGHSGVATVTWRSPLFSVPATSTTASFSLSTVSSYSWTPSPGVVPTYSVHLIDSGTGALRTIVDSNPLPTPSEGWTPADPVALPAGALAPGSIERLEIVVTFPISARAGDATISVATPTLTVAQRAAAPLPTDMPSTTPLFSTPTPSPVAVSVPPRSDGNGATDPAAADDADPTCAVPDVAVVGASASGRALSITGTADVAAGAIVDLLSVDGWVLGHATVDAQGRFAARVSEPAGSSGTTKVVARLADGRRSAPVAVQRRNVLRSVRSTTRGFSIAGTVDAKLARSGRLSIDLELPGDDACDPTPSVHATGVHVDRRTGAYRALVPAAALAASVDSSADPAGGEPELVRTRVTQSAGGRTRAVTTSQVIFAPKSDRRGT